LRSEKGKFWKELLDSKCGGWRELKNTRHLKSKSLWWRDIRKISFLKDWGNNFEENIVWRIGDEKSIRIWEDTWVGNTPLKEK